MTRPRLKVAILCSRHAPGVAALLRQRHRRGIGCDIVCCITSSETVPEEVSVERHGVPCLTHSIRGFSRARGTAPGDLAARRDYDRELLAMLEPFDPDIVMLAGYLLVLTAPMLEAFDGRIINVHHSDLTQTDDRGRPKYPGLRAVRDAIAAGERETRAAAHIVTAEVDRGPVLLRSWGFPVTAGEHWRPHERRMLREAWPPMLMGSIELAGAAFRGRTRPLDIASIGCRELAGPEVKLGAADTELKLHATELVTG